MPSEQQSVLVFRRVVGVETFLWRPSGRDMTGDMSDVSRVLVVDDNDEVLQWTADALRGAGYAVETLKSPYGFSTAVRTHKPQLVLLDVDMPSLSGDQLLELFDSSTLLQNTVVLFYSERPEDELKTLADQSVAAGYLRKSDSVEDLLTVVNMWRAGQTGTEATPANPEVRTVFAAGCAHHIPQQQSVFEREFAKLVTFYSAEQVMAEIPKREPKLVMLGEGLEDMSAVELCKQIREQDQTRAVSILYLADDNKKADELWRAGANLVMSVPINPLEFDQAVAKLANVPTRRDVRVMVRVRVEEQGDALFYVGYSQNISSSGILIETDSSVGVGGDLSLRFFLPGAEREVEAKALVVRVHAQLNDRIVAGAQFVEVAERDRAIIKSFIERKRQLFNI